MDILPDNYFVKDLRNWFNTFVGTYNNHSEEYRKNIDIKREHTERVTGEIIDIGKALGLNENELNLAEIIALLHDIGRFEQYNTYRTFSDGKSENHAELGLKIIKEHDILHLLDPDVRDLVLCSIRYHNLPELPADETERCLFWSRLIRDADKLDIWRVVIDYYYREKGERNVALELELPDTPGFSAEVVAALMNNHIVNMMHVRNINDIKLLQAGWIYDINYPPTFVQIKKRRYMELLKGVLPQSEEVNKIFDGIDSFLQNHN